MKFVHFLQAMNEYQKYEKVCFLIYNGTLIICSSFDFSDVATDCCLRLRDGVYYGVYFAYELSMQLIYIGVIMFPVECLD